MSWGDDVRDVGKPTDHRQRLNGVIATLDADEVRLLLLLGERLIARRPQPGRLDAHVPRDAAGEVAGAIEHAVDLALNATAALTWARRRQT
jgi:hypothetical protein